jgi:hypothetical protein
MVPPHGLGTLRGVPRFGAEPATALSRLKEREVIDVRIELRRIRAILYSNGVLAFLGALLVALLVMYLWGR